MIRPSSLPAVHASPCFRHDKHQESPSLDAGKARHRVFQEMVDNPDAIEKYRNSTDDDIPGVIWAAEYVHAHANKQDHAIVTEKQVQVYDENFNLITEGTPDVVCGFDIFDLKWRKDEYTEQMLAYAAAVWHGLDVPIRIHILFAESQTCETFTVTSKVAEERIRAIIKRAEEFKGHQVSDYCSRCGLRAECPAFAATAKIASEGYAEPEEQPRIKSIKQWHPSKCETGQELSDLLWLASNILEPLCESIRFHALEGAIKRGLTLPGWEICEKRGRQFVSDAALAFPLAGLTQDEFLKCCEVRLNSSKTTKEKVGVIDRHAEIHGKPKAQARRQIIESLTQAEILLQGKPTKYLRQVGQTKNENGEE